MLPDIPLAQTVFALIGVAMPQIDPRKFAESKLNSAVMNIYKLIDFADSAKKDEFMDYIDHIFRRYDTYYVLWLDEAVKQEKTLYIRTTPATYEDI